MTPEATPRTLLLSALRSKPVSRVPWVPFVGVHGGALVGKDATEHLQSADHILAGLKAFGCSSHVAISQNPACVVYRVDNKGSGSLCH